MEQNDLSLSRPSTLHYSSEIHPYVSEFHYLWAVTESEAVEKGLTKEYYKRVKKEITDTNEAIKRGVMKGANVKRIPDFQASQENK